MKSRGTSHYYQADIVCRHTKEILESDWLDTELEAQSWALHACVGWITRGESPEVNITRHECSKA